MQNYKYAQKNAFVKKSKYTPKQMLWTFLPSPKGCQLQSHSMIMILKTMMLMVMTMMMVIVVVVVEGKGG